MVNYRRMIKHQHINIANSERQVELARISDSRTDSQPKYVASSGTPRVLQTEAVKNLEFIIRGLVIHFLKQGKSMPGFGQKCLRFRNVLSKEPMFKQILLKIDPRTDPMGLRHVLKVIYRQRPTTIDCSLSIVLYELVRSRAVSHEAAGICFFYLHKSKVK